ncbi:MAG: hypothetical protein LBR26_07630 [Prevotella sp.]|jgi:hypothetical protein|nr:hypothetical protein [Prevotella sp.]
MKFIHSGIFSAWDIAGGQIAWEGIPYGGEDSYPDSRLVDAIANNGLHDPDVYKGDICRYLAATNYGGYLSSDSWRMPISREFGESDGVYGIPATADYRWTAGNTASASDENGAGASGLSYLTSTYSKGNVEVVFPAAGGYNNSTLLSVGAFGSYWSLSVNVKKAYYLGLRDSAIFHANYGRTDGYNIRCVR